MRLRACAMICIAALGCGSGYWTSPSQNGKATIGPLGGTVQIPDGAALNIVAGALSSDTEITIEANSGSADGALSRVYAFGPAGLQLARPATVSIPVASSLDRSSIFWTPADSTQAQRLPAMVKDGIASAQVASLGTGYAGHASGVTRAVSGQISTVFWADDGSRTTRPGSFGPRLTIPAVWLPAGPGYTQRVPVVPASDGSFSFSGVPEGPYFLEIDTQWDDGRTSADLLEMSSSTPDLSSIATARADVEVSTHPTQVTLHVSGLTPWVRPSVTPSGTFAGDMLLIAGAQAHIYGRPTIASRIPPPAPGATAWQGAWDWSAMSTADAIALPDASRSDVEYVYQRSTAAIGSGPTQGVAHVATRYARIADLTLHDGSAADIAVSLGDAPQTGTLRANLRNSRWAPLLADANPAAVPDSWQGLSVLAIPRTVAFPDMPGLTAGTSLAWVQGPQLTDSDYGTIHYGQFLGPDWKEIRYLLYVADAEVPMPGTSATTTAGITFTSFEAMPADDDVVPVLGPPRLPRIQGMDAFHALSGVGQAPTISWSPPRLGGATSYTVRIDLVSGTAQFSSVGLRVYGVTSVQVPAGLLTPGAQYIATITSFSAPWDALDRAPLRSGVPYSSSDCVTAVFTP